MHHNIQIQYSKSGRGPTGMTTVLMSGLAKIELNLMTEVLMLQVPSWPARRSPALRVRFA